MEHDVLEGIRNEALDAIGLLQDNINGLQLEINILKEQQKKLRSVVKAASDKPEQTNSRPKKQTGIRDVTRKNVIKLIRAVDSEFTIPMLVSQVTRDEFTEFAGMAESTISRAVNVLREEGYVRQIGVEGRAPIYKWAGE